AHLGSLGGRVRGHDVAGPLGAVPTQDWTTEGATIMTDELTLALRDLPEDIDMVEDNPDDGPRYFCCGREVRFNVHPSRWPPGTQLTSGRQHAGDCWYVRLVAARDQLHQS